jgi:hypothetical protein
MTITGTIRPNGRRTAPVSAGMRPLLINVS